MNKLKPLQTHHDHGFTLVEIMIVVAIIALLASIALPSFMRARKRSQATTVKNELRLLDGAVDQYAIERNVAAGTALTATDIATYLKSGTRMRVSADSGSLTDSMNHAMVVPAVDVIPSVPSETYAALSDVANDEFWKPYLVGGAEPEPSIISSVPAPTP